MLRPDLTVAHPRAEVDQVTGIPRLIVEIDRPEASDARLHLPGRTDPCPKLRRLRRPLIRTVMPAHDAFPISATGQLVIFASLFWESLV